MQPNQNNDHASFNDPAFLSKTQKLSPQVPIQGKGQFVGSSAFDDSATTYLVPTTKIRVTTTAAAVITLVDSQTLADVSEYVAKEPWAFTESEEVPAFVRGRKVQNDTAFLAVGLFASSLEKRAFIALFSS